MIEQRSVVRIHEEEKISIVFTFLDIKKTYKCGKHLAPLLNSLLNQHSLLLHLQQSVSEFDSINFVHLEI